MQIDPTPPNMPQNNNAQAPGLFDQPPADPAEADLVDRIFDYIVTQLPEAAAALPRVDELKADVRAEFAGSMCYVAIAPKTERGRRVSEVLRLFDGRNATEVARRLNISRATVYRLIKQSGRSPAG